MAYSEGIIVIPARYNSHRLPGKALKDIAGKTMIRRTYERAVLSEMDAMVVTDDKRIVNECLSHDIPVDIVTAPCFTGTDRVARFAQKVDKKWFINLQGDEPFANPDDILRVARQMDIGDRREVVNGMAKITNSDDLFNTAIPKVITKDGRLLYMTRAPAPYPFSGKNAEYHGHQQVCVYGFFKHHLEKFLAQPEKTFYENIEDIEILRFHEMGIPIRMLELAGSPLHVDTIDDLQRAQLIAKDYDAKE